MSCYDQCPLGSAPALMEFLDTPLFNDDIFKLGVRFLFNGFFL